MHPRDGIVDYEVPSNPSTQYEQPPPFDRRDEDLSSIESEPSHGLEAGQLQLREGDFGTDNLDETELEQVNVVVRS